MTLKPREFCLENLWRWEDDEKKDRLFVVQHSCEMPEYPVGRNGYVRGKVTALFMYEKLPPVHGFPQTKMTYTVEVDLGGLLPRWAAATGAVDELM